ncbi:MAG: cytochrome-c peroxidase [Burkholderiales bacterium]
MTFNPSFWKNSARISLVALGVLAVHAAPPASLGLPPLEPPNAAQAEIGRRLFFDRRLSPNQTMSCAMCHVPEQGFASNEVATSVGMFGKSLRRNAPTSLNVAYQQSFFHDGRESSLESQVWAPLLSKDEMNNASRAQVVGRIRALPGYEAAFVQAFPARGIGEDTIATALAAYQRTLVAGGSRFDRWYFGGETGALTAEEQKGLELFRGKAGCVQCHLIGRDAALFTDHRFHRTGAGAAPPPEKLRVELAPGVEVLVARQDLEGALDPPALDLGRWEVTGEDKDRMAFRSPSLRNISLTAPYMHDGSLGTLEEVIGFYDRGGQGEDVDLLIKPLGLSAADKGALAAFLRSLTAANASELISAARKGFGTDHISR